MHLAFSAFFTKGTLLALPVCFPAYEAPSKTVPTLKEMNLLLRGAKSFFLE